MDQLDTGFVHCSLNLKENLQTTRNIFKTISKLRQPSADDGPVPGPGVTGADPAVVANVGEAVDPTAVDPAAVDPCIPEAVAPLEPDCETPVVDSVLRGVAVCTPIP